MTARCGFCYSPIRVGAKKAAARAGKAPVSCGAKGHTEQLGRRRRKLAASGLSGSALDRALLDAAKGTGERMARKAATSVNYPPALKPPTITQEQVDAVVANARRITGMEPSSPSAVSGDLDVAENPETPPQSPHAPANAAFDALMADLDKIAGR